jgi:hypothetical protein
MMNTWYGELNKQLPQDVPRHNNDMELQDDKLLDIYEFSMAKTIPSTELQSNPAHQARAQ